MALNVNGYNDTFQSFVDFAKIRNTMGEKTAIARVTTGVNVAEGALAGRTITASDTDSVRGLFKWTRSADDKAANNEARKALSVLMNQSSPGDIAQLVNSIPVQDKNAQGGALNMHELGGADKLVHRNIFTDKYETLFLSPEMTFSLDIAPDGKSAVVTIRLDNDLHEGHKKDDFFGKAVIQERITVDLRPDIPVVTDVQLGQELQ